MKYRIFIFLFFCNMNYHQNIFDIFSNAYNEPLSVNFFANNKIATGGGVLLIAILSLQIKTIHHIFKEDHDSAKLFSKKNNLTRNIHDTETDNEDLDDIQDKINKKKISETQFNKKISQGCSHYLWVSLKKSLNPFKWFKFN